MEHTYLQDASGRTVNTYGYIITDIIIQFEDGEVEIPSKKILLINEENWSPFLVGRDILKSLRLLPGSVLKEAYTSKIMNKITDSMNKDNWIKKLEEFAEDINSDYDILRKTEDFRKRLNDSLSSIIGEYYRMLENNQTTLIKQGIRLSKRKDNMVDVESQFGNFSCWIMPPFSSFCRTNLLTGNYIKLIENWKFKATMIDPPWTLGGSSPTRGLHINYEQLSDEELLGFDFTSIMGNGYYFIWCINSKLELCLEWMQKYNVRRIEVIEWIKITDKDRPFSSMGHWLRHRKEMCLVGRKGEFKDEWLFQKESDVIVDKVTIPMAKPKKIYELIERCLPNGYYLELFSRGNNIRNKWLTIGNEVPQVLSSDLVVEDKIYGFHLSTGERCNSEVFIL
eukprot:snap_masked-scaffold_39-processed-gene-1.26-mRNA-1 protein AED:0.25 eAED:0.25 QI:0/-1/0/1/-1/1/1/0/394